MKTSTNAAPPVPLARLVGHSCSAQLISDWTDASIITIDGIDFAPVGHDGECGFDNEDLNNGLQLRIWETVQLIASAFGGEVLDCRPNEKSPDAGATE